MRRVALLLLVLPASACVRELTLERRVPAPGAISASSGPHEVLVEWSASADAERYAVRISDGVSEPIVVESGVSSLRWAALDTSLSWSFEVAAIDGRGSRSELTGPVAAKSLPRSPLDPEARFTLGVDGERGASVDVTDVDGDGVSEVLIGSPDTIALRAELYSFRSGVPEVLWTATVTTDFGSSFGASVAAGDFDRDGRVDLAVGRPTTGGGRVDVFFGLTSGWNPVPVAIEGPASSDFGRSLAADGDLDGDGFDDLIVGMPELASNQGRAEIFSGSAAGLKPEATWFANGNAAGAEMGSALATGDLDGDGRRDVVVASDHATLEENQQGAAFAYLGGDGGPSLFVGWEGHGLQEGASFGTRISAAGDANCDGFDDLLVSAPRFAVGGTIPGALYLHYGSPSGPSLAPDRTFIASGLREAGKGAVLTDLDGDGCAEIAVSTDAHVIDDIVGSVRVYDGRTGFDEDPITLLESDLTSPGRALASVGDVDGDGLGDLMLGDHIFGSVLEIRTGRARTGPLAGAGFAQTAEPGSSVSPVGSLFRDVRSTRATYTCTWDFGDGSAPAVIASCDPDAPGEGVSHAYESRGRYALTLRVSCDDDGRAGEAATTVVVDQLPD